MIHTISLREYEKFVKCRAREKYLIYSLPNCKPCIALLNSFSELITRDLVAAEIYAIKLDKNNEQLVKLEEILGISHFPTLIFYIDNSQVGLMRGFVYLDNNGPSQLLRWIERKRKKFIARV